MTGQYEALLAEKKKRERAEKIYENLAKTNPDALSVEETQRLYTLLAEADEAVAMASRAIVYGSPSPESLESIPYPVHAEPILGGSGARIVTGPLPIKQNAGSSSAARWCDACLRRPLGAYFEKHPLDYRRPHVIHIRLIYHSLKGRHGRDFDNHEMKAFVDVICRASHIGDRPDVYTLIVTGTEGEEDATEAYVFPLSAIADYEKEYDPWRER